MNRQTLRTASLAAAMLGVVLVGVALLGACGGSAGAARWDAKDVAESIKKAPFTPVNINSNLGMGPTRVAVALFKPDQTLVLDAQITARLYRLADDPEQSPTVATAAGSFTLVPRTIDIAENQSAVWPRDHLDGGHALYDVSLAAPRGDPGSVPGHEDALLTMYTAMVNFDRAGLWGAELDVKSGGKTYRNLRLTLNVAAHTSEPAVGDPAPRSKQPILKDVKDIAEIDTATPPHPELHDITLADAIASGKPVVAAFVTPLFCQTRFCGPVLNTVVLPAWKQYGDRVQFMHIEPYDIATAKKGTLQTAPATQEWHLLAEPFIAVIDREGKVAAKFEGIIALEELTQVLDAVLAAK